MKKIILLFLFFTLIFFNHNIFASDNESNELFQDFQNNYRRYQEYIEPYQTSKSREQTYQSLDSQLELVEASKKLLSSEIEAIIGFIKYLRSYLAESTKILNYRENLIYVMLDDEISFFSSAREKVSSLSTISEVQPLADSFLEHYQKMSQYSYQIKALTETESANKILENLVIEKGKIENFLSQLGTESAKIKMAKEKCSEIHLVINQTEEILALARDKQKKINKDDFLEEEKQIHDLINQVIEKEDIILAGYQNVIANMK